MHRMVFKISPLALVAALAQTVYAAPPSATPGLSEVFADKLGETPESIKKLPYIIGDPETQRRDFILKAYELRIDKFTGRDQKQYAQLDEYLRAADRIRSSTFTRCNLAMLAHYRGDEVGAAEYFQRERSQPLAENAGEDDKRLRHVCETYAALAYERVGMIKIVAPNASVVWVNHRMVGTAPIVGYVFVKPEEEQNVRIVLDDESELKKKILLRAGQSTTLEFHSSKKEEAVQEPPAKIKSPSLPPVAEPEPMKRDMPDAPEERNRSGWRRDLMVGGTVAGGIGLGTLIGSMIWKFVAQGALESTWTEDGERCANTLSASKNCERIKADILSADRFIYLSSGLLGAGFLGMTISAFYPSAPQQTLSAERKAKNAALPTGLILQGVF